MPVLYWDGEELAQSMAIARFVARKVLKITNIVGVIFIYIITIMIIRLA